MLKVTCAQFAEAYIKASNTGGIDDTGNSGDRFGYSVALSGDTLVVGANREDSGTTGTANAGTTASTNNNLTDSGAVYVFTRSGTTWSQQAYLKASNAGGGDRFGSSVALSGDTLVVGADGEAGNATGVNGDGANNSPTESGAVYVRRIAP